MTNSFTTQQQEQIRQIVRDELEKASDREPKMGRCAYCEGSFPEHALNYRSGDPACAGCQATVAPDGPIRTPGRHYP